MITEHENQALEMLRQNITELTGMMSEGFENRGVEVDSHLEAHAGGTQLAMYDALFAIREGTEWRGMTDPKEIARRILRDTGIGE
jgi:hypothetical protein